MTRIQIQIDFECPATDDFWQGAVALLGDRLTAAAAAAAPFEVTPTEWAALQALPGWSADYPAYAPHPLVRA